MAKGARRKQIFIGGIFAVLALVLGFLMFRDIPAPLAEKTIELDAEHVLR